MFRVSQHPSSGVLKTVTAASGTGHNIGTATSIQRGQIDLNYDARNNELKIKHQDLDFCLQFIVHGHPHLCDTGRQTAKFWEWKKSSVLNIGTVILIL